MIEAGDLLELGAGGLLGQVEPAFEGGEGPALGGAGDDRLEDLRRARAGDRAEDLGVGRDLPVVEHVEVEHREGPLEDLEQHGVARSARAGDLVGCARAEEQGSDGDLSWRVTEQIPGDVGHDPRAVAGAPVGSARASVFDAGQRAEGPLEVRVSGDAVTRGDEPDAARRALTLVAGDREAAVGRAVIQTRHGEIGRRVCRAWIAGAQGGGGEMGRSSWAGATSSIARW